ncbi:MAG: ankyrin repeat domain-containing protein [Rickettsiella sp.]|nr:ankyrin repeat domain-containing protein [Rickettsiella sp.]
MVKNKKIKRKFQSELNAKLISATVSGFPGQVRRFLKKGANSNSVDENGKTVLYIAAKKGDAKIVNLLLKKGAKNNVSKDITPLDIAVIFEHLEVIQLLIKDDRDVDLNHNKETVNPLSLAIFHEKLESVKLLLKNGAEVLTKHIPQKIECGTHEIIKLLIPHLLLGDPTIPMLECIQACQELLTTWNDSLTQIKKMQNIFISEAFSLYDLLKLDSNRLVKGVTKNNLVEAKNINFSENFSSYSNILQKKLEALVALKEKQHTTALQKNIIFFNNPSANASMQKEKTMFHNCISP